MATVILNPDVPVSYAVIVTNGGNFTCAMAGGIASAVPINAMAASFMNGVNIPILPLGLALQPGTRLSPMLPFPQTAPVSTLEAGSRIGVNALGFAAFPQAGSEARADACPRQVDAGACMPGGVAGPLTGLPEDRDWACTLL
jgi:hypothetical protein